MLVDRVEGRLVRGICCNEGSGCRLRPGAEYQQSPAKNADYYSQFNLVRFSFDSVRLGPDSVLFGFDSVRFRYSSDLIQRTV